MKKGIEALPEWLDNLKKTDKQVVVEGKNDAAALRSLGFKGVIIELTGRALYQVIEEVSDKYKSIIILTDLDREGKKLYSILKSGLLERGVQIDNYFREWLFKNTKLRQIEGLTSYCKP